MLPLKNLSKEDRRKILRIANEEGRGVFVRQKSGGLRVYHLERFLNHRRLMRELAKIHKPWARRQKPPLGPIGSRPLDVQGNLSREGIYEGR